MRVCISAGTATPYVTSKFVWGKLHFCFATTGAFLWIFAPAQAAHKQQCSACRSVGALLIGLRRRGALVGGCVVLFPVVLCVVVVATMSGVGRLLPPFSGSCYRGLLSFAQLRYIFPYTRAPAPAGGEKGHGGPAEKEMQKTFSFWAESVLSRFGFFFLLFVLQNGGQNLSVPFVGPPLSTRATALGHARPGPPGCAQTTMRGVSFAEVWEKN